MVQGNALFITSRGIGIFRSLFQAVREELYLSANTTVSPEKPSQIIQVTPYLLQFFSIGISITTRKTQSWDDRKTIAISWTLVELIRMELALS